MTQKLKYLVQHDRLFISVLICLVGVVAFVLGRYSVQEINLSVPSPLQTEQNQAGVVFIDVPEAEAAPHSAQDVQVTVVASKNGSKYHLLTCSGAHTIKEENKIYFNSIEEAKAAGYTPAANCVF